MKVWELIKQLQEEDLELDVKIMYDNWWEVDLSEVYEDKNRITHEHYLILE